MAAVVTDRSLPVYSHYPDRADWEPANLFPRLVLYRRSQHAAKACKRFETSPICVFLCKAAAAWYLFVHVSDHYDTVMEGPDDNDDVNAAIQVLKLLRRVDQECGVRNSRIAFDVALVMFEMSHPPGLSVDQLVEQTGYSGPTIRLILKRLTTFETVEPTIRAGKTQYFAPTSDGRHKFAGYLRALQDFRSTSTSAP